VFVKLKVLEHTRNWNMYVYIVGFQACTPGVNEKLLFWVLKKCKNVA